VVEDRAPRWTFLTNHARVLVCIAEDPGIRLIDISERIGITERAAHRIVAELAAAGYITRNRNGRRNTYLIHSDLPLPDALVRDQKLGDLLAILAPNGKPAAGSKTQRSGTGNSARPPLAPRH
jgi:Winged helix-turn-helix DNA-binding